MKKRGNFWLALLLCGLIGCGGGVYSSGDRVLVSKYAYDSGLGSPERWEVVVFKYPKSPIENGVPKNYIKRLLGLPGEILAIFFGQLFVYQGPVNYPPPSGTDPLELWRIDHVPQNGPIGRPTGKDPLEPGPKWLMVHADGGGWKTSFQDSPPALVDEQALALWKAKKFKILRKPVDTLLALRRIVYDNDYPARDLRDIGFPPRWAPVGNTLWTAAEQHGFRIDGGQGEPAWLRYRHLLRPARWPSTKQADRDRMIAEITQDLRTTPPKPQLITDFEAYNAYRPADGGRTGCNWVGDLMLECKLTVDKAQGEFWMELSRGHDRFQARWDLSTGMCRLFRLERGKQPQELAAKETRVKAPGDYQLRFANFDERLTVWVDRDLPFDAGVVYDSSAWHGPDDNPDVNANNDLQPASVASVGAAVRVHQLKLWRDTYYTLGTGGPDADTIRWAEKEWSSPGEWGPLRAPGVRTMYVHPGHYLCLGDNSPASSDSRDWGLVPERLLLGRALLVYFPLDRAGRIK